MSVATGLIVANIYYCQPLIILISKAFAVEESRAGVITFLTQAGYAAGLLFFVPLGDKFERRGQIMFMTSCAVVALVIAAVAPNLVTLEIASFLIGATSIVPQLILPLAAALTSPDKRGKVIGTIMSGLIIGILLSRTLSGFIGAIIGWRGMFWIAAGISLSLLVLMRLSFPESRPAFKGSYGTLMRSLLTLIKEQPLLREASLITALAFANFGMFWTTMVLHLAGDPFHYGSDRIGMFGLAAAMGALAAPLVGGAADKRNPRIAVGYGILVMLISYVIFFAYSFSILVLIIGIVLLDLGMQGIHVSNQSRVYTLLPEARNRLNTVYMTIGFTGTSLGSAIGLIVWESSGWKGVCIAGVVISLLCFLVYGLTYRKTPR
jgi:predicted MFS family arabinose efflux permease